MSWVRVDNDDAQQDARRYAGCGGAWALRHDAEEDRQRPSRSLPHTGPPYVLRADGQQMPHLDCSEPSMVAMPRHQQSARPRPHYDLTVPWPLGLPVNQTGPSPSMHSMSQGTAEHVHAHDQRATARTACRCLLNGMQSCPRPLAKRDKPAIRDWTGDSLGQPQGIYAASAAGILE